MALVAERGTPVQLTFAPDRVTIGAATQGQARARETVQAEFSGDEPAIAFSPHYLLDGVVAGRGHATHGEGRAGGETAPEVARVRLRLHRPGQARGDHMRAPTADGKATSGTSSSRSASCNSAATGRPAPGTVARGLGLHVLQRRALCWPRALMVDVVAVVGEQQRGEQPDEHRDQQQRKRREPAGPVGDVDGTCGSPALSCRRAGPPRATACPPCRSARRGRPPGPSRQRAAPCRALRQASGAGPGRSAMIRVSWPNVRASRTPRPGARAARRE